ncbi:MAG: spore germination protein [Clostridiaceae bacterium]|nr:spore germination protein [Clostridiaceae bacterium]
MKKLLNLKKDKEKKKIKKKTPEHAMLKKVYLKNNLDENLQYIKDKFKNSQDIIYRSFSAGKENSIPAVMIYVDGMVSKEIVNNNILHPLMHTKDIQTSEPIALNKIIENILTVSEVETSNDFQQLANKLLLGSTVVLIEGYNEALLIESEDAEVRAVEEPNNEQTLRGPRDSFVEGIQSNIVLIRKRICNPRLAVEFFTLGRQTQTNIALVYLEGTASSSILNKIRDKIKKINEDTITNSANVEQLIEEHKWSIFPQIMATERPDRIAGGILEGRIAIMVDGTPIGLIAPTTFAMYFNSADDYVERSVITSMVRVMRYISYLIATTLPALYTALTAFHPGMLPTRFVLYITGTRVGLPFPFLVEILFMEFTLEMLLEAAVRLPKPVGQTVGIVGGLVIGQAVVQAGIVSPIVVIIVALTAITSFASPNYTFSLSNRVIRIGLIIIAATWGLYGIVIGWLIILIHMASMESFGVRYLEDFSPYRLEELRDTIFKAPKWLLKGNPQYFKDKNTKE